MQLNCTHCGKPFEGRPNRAYCSQRCKAAINNRRYVERDKQVRDSELKIRINRNILFKLHQLLGDVPIPLSALSKSAFEFGIFSGISRKGDYLFLHDLTLKQLPNENFQILKTAELNV
jgi:endogenous inhibitor of DNA gyrase (YacG/DUF329 family)